MTDIKKRVVITSYGSCSAAGRSDDLWNASINKKSCLTLFTDKLDSKDPMRFVGRVNLDMDGIFPAKVRSFVSRHCLLGASSMKECVENSGLTNFSDGRTGLIFGSATHGLDRINGAIEEVNTKNFDDINYNIVNSISNGGVCQILATHFNINGYVHAVEGASCSGMIALHTGYNLIKSGLCDRVFCVVGEANLFPVAILFYNRKIRINGMTISFFGKKRDPENRLAKDYVVPFCNPEISDRGAIAEGGSAILLESEESAQSRGASIRAEIEGADLFFQNTGTHSDVTADHGMISVIKNLGQSEFDSVYFPVTGCYPLDFHIYKVCSSLYPGIHAATVEPVIGHTGAASSLLNVVLAVISLQKNTLLPTLNIRQEKYDPVFKLKPSNDPVFCHPIKRILIAGVGWGGYAGSCSISRYKTL